MKVNLRILANPYMAFVLIWLLGMIVYKLEWSDAFPTMSVGLFVFLTIGIFFSLAIGILLYYCKFFNYSHIHKITNIKLLLFVNLIAWIANFIYSKVPLLEILTGVDYDYTQFGIPIIIVFITCYNSFLCVYNFHCYLTTNKKKYLLYYFLCIGLFVLAYSRGLIMITGISTTFLWLAYRGNNIKLKHITILLVIAVLILFFFGYAGNVRTAQLIAKDNSESSYEYNNKFILEIASASPKFTDSYIPNEFFWTYVYIASPISNLQLNVSKGHVQYTFSNLLNLVINETWYETISKRLAIYFPAIKRKEPDLVFSNLNVSTVFTRSYLDLGFFGLVIMMLYMLVLPAIYIIIIGKKSQYLPVAVAIMCSIYFFTIFDNMFEFVGTGPQLLFPLMFEFKDRLGIKIK